MELVIHHENAAEHMGNYGLVPRNFTAAPHGSLMYAKPFSQPLIPTSEIDDRMAELAESKARLSDVRAAGMGGMPIPSRNQAQKGYCWAHDPVSAALVVRAKNNEPYVDFSAYMVACIIKGYRDEGGWAGEAVDFISKNGIASSEFWPQQSMDRANDNQKMRDNAKQHIFTSWSDIDPNQTQAQVITSLLTGDPCCGDFNWWGHSVCILDVVKGTSHFMRTRLTSGKLADLHTFEKLWDMDVTGGYGTRIWNSWGDSWSENGTGVLAGSKAWPDSALSIRVAKPSLN